MLLEVDRQDLTRTQWVDAPPIAADGVVSLRLDAFALTANNISYALAGDMLDYWGFFPTTPPWGRIPVMGAATVVASPHAEIELGSRWFGFFPMADVHTVEAVPTSTGFADGGEHRARHAGAYRTFSRLAADPAYSPEREGAYLLVKGLFTTSFLIDDFLADQGLSDGAQVVVTSASSKTSIALAHCAAARGNGTVVGVTSAANRDFVAGLGLYDTVVSYDEIDQMSTDPSVIVDMAGNARVLAALHHRLGDGLRHSCIVGATHRDAGGPTGDLPGPTPQFFFAPSQMAKRAGDWGREAFDSKIATALGAFVDASPRWLRVQTGHGPDAAEAAFRQVAAGATDPSVGHVLSVNEEDDR